MSSISEVYDEMISKYGFDDGSNVPFGIEKIRTWMIRRINKALKYSAYQAVPYDRPGVHNWCFILYQKKDGSKDFYDDRIDSTYPLDDAVSRLVADTLQDLDEKFATGTAIQLIKIVD